MMQREDKQTKFVRGGRKYENDKLLKMEQDFREGNNRNAYKNLMKMREEN